MSPGSPPGANGSGNGGPKTKHGFFPLEIVSDNNPGVTVILEENRQIVVVEDKTKTVLVVNNAADVAKHLIAMCGGNLQAAHDAISRVASETKRPRGKPKMRDTPGILVAAYLRRHIPSCGRSDDHALQTAASLMFGEDGAKSAKRRMRDQLAGRTLEEFAQSPEVQASGGMDKARGYLELRARVAAGHITGDEMHDYLDGVKIVLGARPVNG
jgi:hypothetical protein